MFKALTLLSPGKKIFGCACALPMLLIAPASQLMRYAPNVWMKGHPWQTLGLCLVVPAGWAFAYWGGLRIKTVADFSFQYWIFFCLVLTLHAVLFYSVYTAIGFVPVWSTAP